MTPTRQEILAALDALSEEHPSMRFGQLVCFVATLASGPSRPAVYDVEDEAFLQAARRHLKRRERERQLADAENAWPPGTWRFRDSCTFDSRRNTCPFAR
jgi:hypothetical protein